MRCLHCRDACQSHQLLSEAVSGPGPSVADVHILTDEKPFSEYYDAALEAGAPPKLAANWVLGDIMAYSKVLCLSMLLVCG